MLLQKISYTQSTNVPKLGPMGIGGVTSILGKTRFKKRLLGRACNDRRFRNPCIARKGGRGLTHAKMVKDHTFSHFFVPFLKEALEIFCTGGSLIC